MMAAHALVTLGAVLAVLFAGISPVPSIAVCVTGIPLEKQVESYPLVFEADVADVPREIVLRTEAMPNGTVLNWKGLLLRMHVREVWKGEPGKEIEIVYTHHAQQIHGRFDKGERFIVWASRFDGRWLTSDCAPTVERARASADLLWFLDRLKKPRGLFSR